MTPVQIELASGCTLARLPPDVDAANASEIGERLAREVTSEMRGLILDLSQTRFLDSAGIDMLLGLQRRLRHRRQNLRLVVADGSALHRMLEVVSLPSAVRVHPDVERALADDS